MFSAENIQLNLNKFPQKVFYDVGVQIDPDFVPQEVMLTEEKL